MKRLGMCAIGLTLGLWTVLVWADDEPFRVGPPQPLAPVIANWRPANNTPPAAPVEPPMLDPSLRLATYLTPAPQEPPLLMQGGIPLEPSAEPLPMPSPVATVPAPMAGPLTASPAPRAAPAPQSAGPRLVPVPEGQEVIHAPTTGGQVLEFRRSESLAPGMVMGQPIEGGLDQFEMVTPPSRFWVRGEFLQWWTRGQNAPALVTTSPNGTPLQDFGVVGPDRPTTVLFGGGQPALTHPGFRLTGDVFVDDCEQWGVEAGFFLLGQRSRTFNAASDGSSGLARPFFNQNQQMPASELLAIPGLVAGQVAVNMPTELWGAEINARHRLCWDCNYHVDALAGYRYLSLREGLSVSENSQVLANSADGAFVAGDRFNLLDRFDTRNQFHGAQVGLNGEYRLGKWSLEGTFKLGVGLMEQQLTVLGQVTRTSGGVQQSFPGGLFAQGSNIGQYNRDRFAVVPELGMKVHYQVTDHLSAFVGYDFLYLSSVLRPADQIDQTIDVRQIPFFGGGNAPAVLPPSRPVVPFNTSSFWAQGISFGLEYRY